MSETSNDGLLSIPPLPAMRTLLNFPTLRSEYTQTYGIFLSYCKSQIQSLSEHSEFSSFCFNSTFIKKRSRAIYSKDTWLARIERVSHRGHLMHNPGIAPSRPGSRGCHKNLFRDSLETLAFSSALSESRWIAFTLVDHFDIPMD